MQSFRIAKCNDCRDYHSLRRFNPEFSKSQPLSMNHTPILRDAETFDLPAVLDLNQAAVPHVSSVTLADMERFAEIAGYFRVAEVGGRVAGFLIALNPGHDYASDNYRWFNDNFDDFFYIDRIVIADNAQGKGLGAALYQQVILIAKAFAPRLTCEVNTQPPNPQSMAFHEGFGFKCVGTQQTEGGNKEVALLSLDFEPKA